MRKFTIRLSILAVLAVAALAILQSYKKPAKTEDCPQRCCHKKPIPKDNNLIWETFSRQLISVSL
jgi:hypothetical protein